MNLKSFLIILFAILMNSNILFAQEYELGKVTVDELNESVHPIDSSAVAAILFKTGETNFFLNDDGSWETRTLVKYKIKIYKKEGLKYANKSLYYFTGSTENESVKFKDATTYNLVNNKIVKTELKSEGNFKEVVNSQYTARKIILPQVKVGSIIEYSYMFKSPYISNLKDWYFQYDIPVNYVEYNVYIPEYFKYRSVISGYEPIDLEELKVSSNQKFNQVKYTYSKEDIEALKGEGYIHNVNNYMSILKYELASINFPNQFPKNVAITWDDVVKNIYDHEYFGNELVKRNYFEEDIDQVINGLKTNDQKIKAIFHFVKNRMQWNDTYGVFVDNGVKKAYKEKSGSIADINLMLIAMLRYSGIDANPVLLSTRKNGITFFPTRTAFNYVVAGVEVSNDVILLDATNKNNKIDLLPLKAVNWMGRIIRERGSSSEIKLLEVPVSDENITVLGGLDESGLIKGKLRRTLTNYNSFVHRENYKSINTDDYLEVLENSYAGVSLDDFNVKHLNDVEKPIVESYSFSTNNSAEVIGEKIYIEPLLFFTLKESPFKLSERKYPIDFSYPFKDVYNFSIKIPDEYEVEYLPEVINLSMRGGFVSFKYLISSVNNNIQLVVEFDVKTFYVTPEYYPSLKDLFKLIINKQNEKIVLKKKK